MADLTPASRCQEGPSVPTASQDRAGDLLALRRVLAQTERVELLVQDQCGCERRVRACQQGKSMAADIDRRRPGMRVGEDARIRTGLFVGAVGYADRGQLTARRQIQ